MSVLSVHDTGFGVEVWNFNEALIDPLGVATPALEVRHAAGPWVSSTSTALTGPNQLTGNFAAAIVPGDSWRITMTDPAVQGTNGDQLAVPQSGLIV